MSKTRLLLGGIKSFLPIRAPYTMSTQPVDARYGYAVWTRQISALAACGVRGPFDTVVEMGPGNSIATGACAVLSGARTYVGLDVLDHLARDQAERVLGDVETLFDTASPIPDNAVFNSLEPTPESFAFPAEALSAFRGDRPVDAGMRATLRTDIATIAAGARAGSAVRYIYPWSPTAIADGSADLIFSQAVLEEIPHAASDSPLRAAFDTIFRWLRPGGVSCHQIDLGMYGLDPWNIHWTWGTVTWTLLRGRRDNFVNREPLSTYLTLARAAGFEVVATTIRSVSGVPDEALQPAFRRLSDEDRRARAAHLVLRRPA